MSSDEAKKVIKLSDRAEQQMRDEYLFELKEFIASVEHPLLTDDVIELLDYYLEEADKQVDGLGCAATSLFFSDDRENDTVFTVHFMSTYSFVILTRSGHSRKTDRTWTETEIVDNQYMQLNIRLMDTAERRDLWGVTALSNDLARERLIEYMCQWEHQSGGNDPLILAVLMVFHCLVDSNAKILSLEYVSTAENVESILTVRVVHDERHFELVYNYPKMNRLFQVFGERCRAFMKSDKIQE